MARARKVHVQTELRLVTDKNGQFRGGKRKGAGRKPKGKRPGEKHEVRPVLSSHHPVHVTMRAVAAFDNLRTRDMYMAIRHAVATVGTGARDSLFRIVQISVQRTHVHLLVEALDKTALANGMHAFTVSAARALNRAYAKRTGRKRRGKVFPDRYHPEVITTPRQARNALAYVLNNWRKHREDRGPESKTWKIDWFSSGATFWGWKELEALPFGWNVPAGYPFMPVRWAETWLLTEGWLLAGPLIGATEVPGPAA